MAGELHDLPLLVGLEGEADTSAPSSRLAARGHAAGPPGWGSTGLHALEGVTYPLLPVAVLHIVDPAVIPGLSDAQQVKGQETVLRQNHEVREESPQGLDHT